MMEQKHRLDVRRSAHFAGHPLHRMAVSLPIAAMLKTGVKAAVSKAAPAVADTSPSTRAATIPGPFCMAAVPRAPTPAPDGGDGEAGVGMTAGLRSLVDALAERTLSDPSTGPLTGAEPGAGAAAGRTGPIDP